MVQNLGPIVQSIDSWGSYFFEMHPGGVIPKETKGIWLSLFCPENQCLIKESTDLP
jgi:hypothetical protein